MEIIEFTSNGAFNAIFTIYVKITVILVPVFGAIAVTRN